MSCKASSMIPNCLYLLLFPLVIGDNPNCILNCNFDKSVCNWTQSLSDNFNWTRRSGKTSSSKTGPGCDHTSGGGYYIYIETSDPRKLGDKAKLISPAINVTNEMCLVFYYHMNGANINTLNVYFSRSGLLGSPVWTRNGSQGNAWKHAILPIAGGSLTSGITNIVFEGIRGTDFAGDIAIDDVSLTHGICDEEKCDFEIGMCNWTNSKANKFDWYRNSGTDFNDCTNGPATDHTKANSQGQYIFIGHSSRQKGDSAVLQSSTFQSTTGTCMRFYYYMFGPAAGNLSVLVKPQSKNASIVWSLNRQQERTWVKGVVVIPQVATNYQVLFEGTIGSPRTRSIALDDIMFDNQCPCTVTPQHASVATAVPEVLPQRPLETINALVGDNLTVTCEANNANPAVTSITWSHHGRDSSGSTFHIQNVTKSDEGLLTCTAHNGVGTSPGRADTFIRVVQKYQEAMETEACIHSTPQRTSIHTVAVVVWVVAVFIIVALVVVVIHLYRKVGSLSVQGQKLRKPQKMNRESNPTDNQQHTEEPVYQNTNSVYEGTTSTSHNIQHKESLHRYEFINVKANRTDSSDDCKHSSAEELYEETDF